MVLCGAHTLVGFDGLREKTVGRDGMKQLDLFINSENEISFNFQLIWQIDGWMTEQMNKRKK